MSSPSKTSTRKVSPGLSVRVGRERKGSIVKVEKLGEESQADVLDQGMYDNLNAEWVNRKGAWLIHFVLIAVGKIVIDTIPGMPQEVSWTLVNLIYLGFSYLMFHYVTGIPFHSDLHGGVYDNMTLWEQIDNGAQYTPAKKWLFIVPITVFLASTHYTHYDPWLFAVNLSALVFVLIPKLPAFHRYRVRFMVPEDASGLGTPLTSSFPPSGASTPMRTNMHAPPINITEVESRL
ncbi:Orm1 type endoplasmic reticulum protein [Epithele typhae]|uniref:Orm1 type endoplasmic reticulum protein n=1 Tax=Epithele typhae TaxID=378194 RepID=UPI00200869B4|nr:Orm1 type endoplasmic reticulum protein [Epithele typhae]KAH9927087.1 Orm1 type endoplasmic reticulum protein [Epithele typhae]